MRFLPLAELLKERDKLRRWVKDDQKPSLLVQEGILSPEDQSIINESVRKMLRDIEQEIGERTGQNPPAD